VHVHAPCMGHACGSGAVVSNGSGARGVPCLLLTAWTDAAEPELLRHPSSVVSAPGHGPALCHILRQHGAWSSIPCSWGYSALNVSGISL
jgi:hypothetical protein